MRKRKRGRDIEKWINQFQHTTFGSKIHFLVRSKGKQKEKQFSKRTSMKEKKKKITISKAPRKTPQSILE